MTILAVSLAGCTPGGSEDTFEEDDSGHANLETGEPEALAGVTAAHNKVREGITPAPSVPLSPLIWDEELATVAGDYAEKCKYGHSQGEYGENLFAQAGKVATAEEAVGAWAEEVTDYDYETGKCTGKCGHYTQIVWRDSSRVGCGVAFCKTGSPFEGFTDWQYVVCNYDPPGNWIGEKPY